MECRDVKDLINAYIDKELDLDIAKQVENHLQECINCKKEYEELSMVVEMCKELDEVEIPADFHSQLHNSLAKEGGRKLKRRLNWKLYGSAAAILLIVLFAAQLKSMNSVIGNREESKSAADNAVSSEMNRGNTEAFPADAGQKAPSSGTALQQGKKASMDQAAVAPNMNVQTENKADAQMVESPSAAQENQQTYKNDSLEARKIIKSAYISLESKKFDQDINAISGKVNAQGGYVENSNIQGVPKNNQGRTAHFELRVPEKIYDQFLNDIGDFGKVVSQSQSGEDITGQYFDRETRLKTLKIQQERIQSILSKAENLTDVLTLENELARIENEIENITGTLKQWDNMVQYSKIIIDVYEVKDVEGIEPANQSIIERMRSAFFGSMNGLVRFLEDACVFSVSVLPYLLLLLIVFMVGKFAFVKVKKIEKSKVNSETNKEE